MDEYEFARAALILPGLIIIGGFAVVVAAIIRGGKVAELRHRERMAMIERGITPPDTAWRADSPERSHGLKMSLGIMLCGLGLGLLMLITFAAGAPGAGMGIGGAFAMVGLAFIVSALFTKKESLDGAPPRQDPPAI